MFHGDAGSLRHAEERILGELRLDTSSAED
jgi:hypothetical protein